MKKIIKLTESQIQKLIENVIDDESKSNKKGFSNNIEKDTLSNKSFRKVLYTGENLQLVLMTLKKGEEIGMETHTDTDQFFRFESGRGRCIINDNKYNVKDGDVIIIPAGSKHNIINTGNGEFKMYTIYSPPHHKDGIEFVTKKEAEKSKEEFDGKTTESQLDKIVKEVYNRLPIYRNFIDEDDMDTRVNRENLIVSLKNLMLITLNKLDEYDTRQKKNIMSRTMIRLFGDAENYLLDHDNDIINALGD